jgi:3-hexulose-6-phosphate synthase
MVTALNTGAKVSVAGGVKAATVRQVVDAGADIVVAGAAIYGAADPAASAAEITGLARAGNAGAGGMGKWLPWALIAGAVLLGLYLLKGGNSTEEMPAAADAAMEQVEGAAAEGAAAVEGAAVEAKDAVEAAKDAAAAEMAPAEAAPAAQ